MKLTVKELQVEHIPSAVSYFVDATPEFLYGMGADPDRLPGREDWEALMENEMGKPDKEKQFFYVVWEIDGHAVGHSNINKLIYGQEAFMHLHMWKSGYRQKGAGLELVRKSIPFYFDRFELDNLFCEPYALNPAPNKTLPRLGFEFIREYETIPGWISYHQPVRRYLLTRLAFEKAWNR